MLLYALGSEFAFYLGHGIGSISEILSITGSFFHDGHKHLNMHSISIIIFEMGIIFYFLFIFIFSIMVDSLFKSKSYIRVFTILFILLLLTFYARVFEDPRLIYSVIIYALVVALSPLNLKYNISRRYSFTEGNNP